MAAGALQGRDIRLDLARGAAVVAMVVYHLFWDLAALGFIDQAEAARPGFRHLGATIAGSFLLLSGIALHMMWRSASDPAAFRAKFLRRLAIVAGAALLVSLGTWFAMGDRFVRFGVLHCIAASSLLALPLLRAPAWAAAAAGAVLLAVPWLVDLPTFAHTALLWTGLTAQVPAMVDYVPVLPFAGMTLLGLALGPAFAAGSGGASEPGRARAALAWLGRWSLPIYLVHQPVLYGGLMLLASLTMTAPQGAAGPGIGGPGVDRDTAGFRAECRRTCEALNGKEHCEIYCGCAETEMKATDLWRRTMASRDLAPLQRELQPLLQACDARARERR
jgi:uncharacterized membrane protein